MRYLGEVRFRLIGPRERCVQYISQARTVLGELWNSNREIGEVQTSKRRVALPDGVVVTVYIYEGTAPPIIQIEVPPPGGEPPPNQKYLMRSAWFPEGFVLTPSTEDDRDGYGLPTRLADATGERLDQELEEDGITPVNETSMTTGGSWPQVILNRFQNNKYLDDPAFVTNVPEEVMQVNSANRKRAANYESQGTSDITYQYWHTFHRPWSYATPVEGAFTDDEYYEKDFWLENEDATQPGIFRVLAPGEQSELELILTQYNDEDGTHNYYETKAADLVDEYGEVTQQWYCHRPEELLYGSDVYEDIYLYTNGLRVAVGEDEVFRMVRGDGNAALMACWELTNTQPGVFYHSHESYRIGYRTTGGRVFNATGREAFSTFAHNVRENLALLGGTPPEVESGEVSLGVFVAQQWENSPSHYVNMVDNNWSSLSIPFFYSYNGSKLASHQIGGAGTNEYIERHKYGSPPEQNDSESFLPPIPGATCFGQLFVTKEQWVPIYDETHENDVGMVGTFNGANAYSHSNRTHARQVGVGRHIYEIPSGNVRTAPPLGDDTENDDFLSCVGAAMFMQDGERWIRAVYWESDTVLDARSDNYGTYPQEGDWTKIKVVTFPERIMDTSEMPWRYPEPDGEWQLEYEWEFLLADGWLANPPGKVVFNTIGNRFTFSHHKTGDGYTDALQFIASDWTVDRETLLNERLALQTVHFEYDSVQAKEQPSYEMTEYAPTPLIAAVECWTDDANAPTPEGPYTNSEYTSVYKRTLTGTYDLFPHYAINEFGVEDLAYIQLEVDEFSNQKCNRAEGASYADKVSHCWRIRYLNFPSGKQVCIMQQYMEENYTHTPFDATDEGDPNWRAWPGTGEQTFHCVIHHLNETTEDIVYSKIKNTKHQWEYQGDPYFRINGDIEYWMDLNPLPDPLDQEAEPQIIELLYTIVEDNTETGGQPAMNSDLSSESEFLMKWTMSDSRWVYNHDVTPCSFMFNRGSDLGAPPGYKFGDTGGQFIPDIQSVMLFGQDATPGSNDQPKGYWERQDYRIYPTEHIDAPWACQPFADYEVSCYTGYQYYGDSNVWYFGTGKLNNSTMVCNIAPLFSKIGEVECKVLRYDGQIIVRVGINHVNKLGLLPPGYLVPENEVLTWSDWQYYAPPEDGEVLLWSNFDLDEVIGIGEIRDIWPMGKIV